MSIEGRIAIDIGFTDTYATGSVQSVQRIALTATDSYTSGKVAVLTGTITTAGTTLAIAPVAFIDASGGQVSFTSVERAAFKCSQDAVLSDVGSLTKIRSKSNSVSFANVNLASGDVVTLQRTSPVDWTAGTASYTVFLYGT